MLQVLSQNFEGGGGGADFFRLRRAHLVYIRIPLDNSEHSEAEGRAESRELGWQHENFEKMNKKKYTKFFSVESSMKLKIVKKKWLCVHFSKKWSIFEILLCRDKHKIINL